MPSQTFKFRVLYKKMKRAANNNAYGKSFNLIPRNNYRSNSKHIKNFIKTLKNITVGFYTNKNGDSPVNLYDIFKIGSGITSVKNQFLVIGVKFHTFDRKSP